jgi:hypothetical protein
MHAPEWSFIHKERRAKAARRSIAFHAPKASAQKLHHPVGIKTKTPKTKTPEGNSGVGCRTVTEPAPSPRPWESVTGATPSRQYDHSTGGFKYRSQAELSTLPGTGTFYFALTFFDICF